MEKQNETKQLTPVKAIRLKCLDCMCGSTTEVRLCESVNCPLFIFRMGTNPNRAKDKTQVVPVLT